MGKVFVGGLSWETTQDGLSEYFNKYGEVIDCVVMKNVETGKSRGFGFVTFKDPSCVDIVLSTGPHTLDGRTIDPKSCNPRGSSRGQRGEGGGGRGGGAGGGGNRGKFLPKVFLGGLPSSVNETDLSNFFSKYGRVAQVVIMYDQEKKRSRGFGFVSFETEDVIDRVCSERFVTIDGKQVEVKRAEPRGGGRQQGGQPQGSEGWDMSGGMAAAPGMAPSGMAAPMANGMYQAAGWAGAQQGAYAPQGMWVTPDQAAATYGAAAPGFQGWGAPQAAGYSYGQYAAAPQYGYAGGYWPGTPGVPAAAPPGPGAPQGVPGPGADGYAAPAAQGNGVAPAGAPDPAAQYPGYAMGSYPQETSAYGPAKAAANYAAGDSNYTQSPGYSAGSSPRGGYAGGNAAQDGGGSHGGRPSGGEYSSSRSSGPSYHPYRRQ